MRNLSVRIAELKAKYTNKENYLHRLEVKLSAIKSKIQKLEQKETEKTVEQANA